MVINRAIMEQNTHMNGFNENMEQNGTDITEQNSKVNDNHMHMAKKWRSHKSWNVEVSDIARNTFNPIRSIVDGMKLTPNPEKDMIALSIGDPTVFGNLKIPKEIEESVINCIKSHKVNGYGPSVGYEGARKAIAEYVSTPTSAVESKVYTVKLLEIHTA